jgi:Ca2+-binding RTX toxin-like protein
VLQGDAANNRLTGGGGADTLAGGGGIDTVDSSTSFGAVWINLAAGEGFWNDAEGDRFFGIENVQGSAYGDFLVGDAGANALFGGGGNDLLAGGAGGDQLEGGAGNDTIDFTGNFGGVAISLRAGQGNWNAAEGDRYVGIENVKGTGFDDIIEGDANGNILTGGGGEDLFVFGAGFGLDTITDFAGNGAASGDRIQFGAGLFTGFTDLMAHAQQQGGDVIINLDAGNVIQLVGVQLGALTSGDFLF